jgi:hypothetical protein
MKINKLHNKVTEPHKPLGKKIFTPVIESCDLNKWNNVENL